MDEVKVLLIENQFAQFQRFRKNLAPRHWPDNFAKFCEVYPQEDLASFCWFMDLVRVYLNPRFGDFTQQSKRHKALLEILKVIRQRHFHLIILDYILVGSHDALNGIALARKLRDENIDIPILFISREHHDKYHIRKKLTADLEPYYWVNKGHAGRDIQKTKFFKKQVLSVATQLISESDLFVYRDKINKIKGPGLFDRDGSLKDQLVLRLDHILDNPPILPEEKQLIDAIINNTNDVLRTSKSRQEVVTRFIHLRSSKA